jgi:general secretion pathway protein A
MLPIYCEHFSLKREPFAITPDPGFLYLSESHKEALAQLVYGIKSRRGFVVLTGEVGTGKTTLIHCLLDELNGHTKTAMVFNMVVSAKDLLRYICEKFGIAPQGTERDIHDYLNLLEQFLFSSYRNGENVALVIDEAQNLSTEVLENVRLLSNFETANDKLLQILLVGQPELGARLNASDLRQLKQRVALRHDLRPLSLAECKDYIRRRLEVAEGTLSLFSDGSIEVIHEHAGGIPRIVNILCDNGLLTAYALRKTVVGPEIIAEVARDLQLAVLPRIARKAVDFKVEGGTALDRNTSSPRVRQLSVNRTERGISKRVADRETKPEHGHDRFLAGEVHARPNPLPSGESASPKAISLDSVVASSRDMICITRVLTEAMGPMAPFILEEEIAVMGESVAEFPKRRLPELVEQATREILSESAKANCRRVMLKLIREINDAVH